MSKRTWITVIALVASLLIAATGTLAYLTDTDSDVNVMTLGNVDIEQHEMKRKDGIANNATLADGDLEPFVDGIKLYPAYTADPGTAYEPATDSITWGPYVTKENADSPLFDDSKLVGAVDKMVFVENTGDSDAYVRTFIAIETPQGLASDKLYDLRNKDDEEIAWESYGNIVVGNTQYAVYGATYLKALPAGAISVPSLLQVALSHTATNEDVALFGETFEILALSQAVQTVNMPENAAEALNAAFNNGEDVDSAALVDWFSNMEGMPVKTASTAEELAAALAEGGTIVLTDDIELDTVQVMTTIPKNTDATLVLGGNNITAKLEAANSSTSIFNVKPGATFTITGEGEINVEANQTLDYVSAIINNEAGNVVIDGGTYRMTYGSYGEGYLLPTIVDNNSTLGASTVTINGGDFYHTRNMFRNFSNNKTQAATITINGGTFSGAADDEGAIWNQKPSASAPNGAGVVVVNGGTFNHMIVSNEFDDTSVVTVADGISLPVEQE